MTRAGELAVVIEKGMLMEHLSPEARVALANLVAYTDVIDGSACTSEQAEGNGPCSVCLNCLNQRIEILERMLREELHERFSREAAYTPEALEQAIEREMLLQWEWGS